MIKDEGDREGCLYGGEVSHRGDKNPYRRSATTSPEGGEKKKAVLSKHSFFFIHPA